MPRAWEWIDTITLSWPRVRGARYRVLVRDATSGEFVLNAQSNKPRLELPVADLDPSRRYTWRPQMTKRRWQSPWRRRPRPWRDVLPELRLPLPPPEGAAVTPLDLPADEALAHRVVIRDETVGEMVIVDAIDRDRYLVNWAELDPSHRHRIKVQKWSKGSWVDSIRYAPLSPPLSLVRTLLRTDTKPDASDEDQGQLLFLFTCDTEVNLLRMREPDPSAGIEHQIFCRHGGRDYGIGYLMDTLEHYGFKGTFFLDVLLEYQFGPGSLEPIIASIQERGHDIQMHLHPFPHLLLAADESVRRLSTALAEDDPDKFRDALAVAMELFERRVGERPVAYRSGSYFLCDEFLPVLHEFGIKIDSSLYPFKNCRVSPWMRTRTQPFLVGNVVEVPVSWVLDHRADEKRAEQFAPMKRDSGQQDPFVAMSGAPGGPPATLIYMAHSYSMLSQYTVTDGAWQRWNEGLRATATDGLCEALWRDEFTPSMTFYGEPDEDRMWILERGLARLASRNDVTAITFKELSEYDPRIWTRHPAPVDPLPEWHREARRGHISGTRRYSKSFLRELELPQSERRQAQPAG